MAGSPKQMKLPGETAGKPQDGKPRMVLAGEISSAGLGEMGRMGLQELLKSN